MTRIAYILDYFPALSQTFVVREILELKKNHTDVTVFARQDSSSIPACGEVIHGDARQLMRDVIYLPDFSEIIARKPWSQIIRHHLYFFLRCPLKYIRTFWFALRQGKGFFSGFILSVFYARELVKAGINHMHVHFALESCTYAMLISMYTGISFSFTVHAHDIFISNLANVLENKFRNAKFVVCISEYNKNFVLKQFPSLDVDKFKIVHCGIDISSFLPNSRKSDGKYNIVSIGRLVEHKGFKYLIEACHLLKANTDINFLCNIIGEGRDREELEELIVKYNLIGIVKLLGAREQSDIMRILSISDLFVLPCVTESRGMQDGIPVALMEAMSMKIPVISTSLSGIPELIKDGSGLLVKPRDAQELASAMENILQMSPDEKERTGSNGRRIIENDFNIVTEVAKLRELFVH